MKIRVLCEDAVDCPNDSLIRGNYYTVKMITASHIRNKQRSVRELFYQLKELPSLNFRVDRFKVVGKIDISLPDDIYNLPLL